MFAEAGDGVALVLLPVPTGADLLAILCRVIRQVGGRRAVVAFVVAPAVAHSVLGTLGLPVEPARFAPARASPQAELAWDDPA